MFFCCVFTESIIMYTEEISTRACVCFNLHDINCHAMSGGVPHHIHQMCTNVLIDMHNVGIYCLHVHFLV